MSDAVAVFNAGSSSIKFALYETMLRCVFRGQIEGLGNNPKLAVWDAEGNALLAQPLPSQTDHASAIARILDWIEAHDDDHRLIAAGHRVVHGGDRYSVPVRVDDAVFDALQALTPLAPLHQPHNLAGLRAIAQHRPALPQVACFDTAFHQTQPEIARLFALPRALSDAGIKRYGFHGLSYEYVAGRMHEALGERAAGKVVIAHLGNGASLCALMGGLSVASTMGFTALDGLMMGTRTGSLDPGVLLHLFEAWKMSLGEVTHLLYHASGLLGVSGISSDMRLLLASPDPRAKQAVELFVYRIVRELGSLASALGGLDALVFTAGIGEHAAPVRAAVCRHLGWLGVELEPDANARHARVISPPASRVTVAVLSTNEEEMIAQHALRVLGTAARH